MREVREDIRRYAIAIPIAVIAIWGLALRLGVWHFFGQYHINFGVQTGF